MALSRGFSDFWNENVASFFRALNAKVTMWLPFSLAETIVLALPFALVALIAVCARMAKKSWRHTIRFSLSLLSVLALIYTMFVFTFAAGYKGSTLDEKLGLEDGAVSAEELYYTAAELLDDIAAELDDVDFEFMGASKMPYGIDELNEKLMTAYDAACGKYPFIQRLRSRVKPIALSYLMTYTHISGVYSFFTGEANINYNYPDYVVVYTAAHELAHQRGIARENEANFVAFLVCCSSDDPYIRYSGYINMFDYVTEALWTADQSYYRDIMAALDRRAVYEEKAYSEFFDKYRDSVAADVSGAVNNTYLVLQGTEGTKSYGMVVDLAVAYYLAEAD